MSEQEFNEKARKVLANCAIEQINELLDAYIKMLCNGKQISEETVNNYIKLVDLDNLRG